MKDAISESAPVDCIPDLHAGVEDAVHNAVGVFNRCRSWVGSIIPSYRRNYCSHWSLNNWRTLWQMQSNQVQNLRLWVFMQSGRRVQPTVSHDFSMLFADSYRSSTISYLEKALFRNLSENSSTAFSFN